MTFYCIHQELYNGVELRVRQLMESCLNLSVEFVVIDSRTANYSSLPRLRRGDFLYNVARGSQTLELLLLNNDVTTFYINEPVFAIINDSTRFSINHDKYDLPAPRTIFQLTTEKSLLRKYVDYLGGFPIVLKATGGTSGVGTILVSDFENLFSLTEYIASLNSDFILRQYIQPCSIARVVVVGNRVISSVEKFVPNEDFRTRPCEISPQAKEFSKEVKELAIRATHLSNFENAGVDILIDKEEKPYLLEVNMPHGFEAAAQYSGIPIATIMVEHLIDKLGKHD